MGHLPDSARRFAATARVNADRAARIAQGARNASGHAWSHSRNPHADNHTAELYASLSFAHEDAALWQDEIERISLELAEYLESEAAAEAERWAKGLGK